MLHTAAADRTLICTPSAGSIKVANTVPGRARRGTGGDPHGARMLLVATGACSLRSRLSLTERRSEQLDLAGCYRVVAMQRPGARDCREAAFETSTIPGTRGAVRFRRRLSGQWWS